MGSSFHKKIQSNKRFAAFCFDKRISTVIERFKLSLLLLIIYLFLHLLHIGCPIRFITGISCPGCGMTRAVLSAFRMDFSAAFYYHPLFLLAPVMFLLFLFEAYIPSVLYRAIWIIIIFLFLTVYLVRIFMLHNTVVSIDIRNGIVLKLINQLLMGGFS